MTINSETRVAGPFDGNDSTVSFPFTFKVFDSDEVRVVAETGAVETDLELGTDYTVTLNADQNATPGGSVVLVNPLATGTRLTLTSALEMLQPVDLTNQGGFYPRVINSALDRLTILLQQLASVVSRTLKFPLSDGPVGDLPGRSLRAGTVLAFDEATGEPVAGPDISSVNGVAGALVAVNTVADNIADVNTVADNIADVNAVGQSIADVNTVAGNMADVNTVAGNIADVNTVAGNITDLSNFSGVYYGPSATDPTTRRDGSPLQVGDLYFNTVINAMRTYNGSVWRESVTGAVTVQNLSGDGVETEFLLDYAPESEVITNVFVNGVYRQKNTYVLGGANGDVLVFDEAPPAGTDNIEVVVSSLVPSDDKLRQELASTGGAARIGTADGSTVQGVLDLVRTTDVANAKTFGAIGDGNSHPLSERYATLTDAQAVYPHATSLTQEIDSVAIQAALNAGRAVVNIPGGQYRIDPSGLSWPAGVRIECYGTLIRVGTPTAPCLLASTAGTFHFACGSFDDGGHSAQFGMLEVNHPDAVLITGPFVWAHNGYSCIWARNAKAVDIGGGEFWDTSHNLYFGQNNAANLPCSVERVTVRGAISHNARAGGDGLKTVSGVKKLAVIGGRYYANAQDGMDLFAGCDEAMLIGVDCSGNTVNGVDIKIGVAADYPSASWGQRRRISIIGGHYSDNTEVGVKVYGEATEGYFQDVLIQGANIIGNQIYGIQCRGVAPRILNNLLLGNCQSTASNYAVIYMQGDAANRPKGGVIAHNTIGNNGVAGKTNIGINVLAWDSLLIDGNIIGNTADREEAQELDWGISVDAGSTGVHVVNNQMGALNTYKFNLAAGSCIVGTNPGVPLKTRGTATIASGTTSVAINHGAAGRPNGNSQIRFWSLGNNFGSAEVYPGATTTTQINAAVPTAPSSSRTIGWEVDLTDEVNTYAITY